MGNQLSNDVNKCRKLLNKASDELSIVESYIEAQDYNSAIIKAIEFEASSEKLTNIARLLPQGPSIKTKEQISDNICSLLNITLGFDSFGFFKIDIPALLPKKEKGNASYIRASVQVALKKYFENHPSLDLGPIVLVFNHVYSYKRPERMYRDHDNIEINVIVDSIAMYCLTDDSPFLCNHFYTSSLSQEDKDRTEIFLIPQDKFIAFLTQYGFFNH